MNRIYELTDHDLPAVCHAARAVFMRPTFGQKPQPTQTSGYEKARAAAERIRQQSKNQNGQKEQLALDGSSERSRRAFL